MIKETLTLRKHCQEHEIPLISEGTESFLRSWITEHKPKRIAEIGSAIGYSTIILAESMKLYTKYGSVDSREISYPHYRQSLLNVKEYTYVHNFIGNVRHIPLQHYITRPYDLLFIDGRKSETLDYMMQRVPYVQEGGSIIVDDVIKFKEKMGNLYVFLDKNDIKHTVHQLDSDDGILILKVTPHLIQALSLLSTPS